MLDSKRDTEEDVNSLMKLIVVIWYICQLFLSIILAVTLEGCCFMAIINETIKTAANLKSGL